MMKKIALIREGKTPPDRRVPLTPAQCKEILGNYEVEILVQPSPVRCFEESEYEQAGCRITENIQDADILLGVKEVPIKDLLANKTYLFFSHTIKKQPYNRNLLREILAKNIRIVDYEVLTNKEGDRVIAFGRYAGIVGAYNGILAYGKRSKRFDLKPANQCFDMDEMWQEFKKVALPALKIAVTGGGRVAKGAVEVLRGMNIKEVSPNDYLSNQYSEAVFTQLRSKDYHHKPDGSFETSEFYKTPEVYQSNFLAFAKQTDVLIAAAYWSPKSPVLFTKEDMKQDDFRIQVIADVTCDIDGSIPSTQRPSTIADPLYDYNPKTEQEEPALSSSENITVMAVDNLPCELPRNASEDFGRELIDQVLPYLLFEHDAVWLKENNFTDSKRADRASITKNGELTPYFAYLEDYVKGATLSH